MIAREELRAIYSERFHKALEPLAEALEQLISEIVKSKFPRIDRVSVRPKDIDRFLDKAEKKEDGQLKYTDPMSEILDQLGARIVTFYVDDVEEVAKIIRDFFGHIEEVEKTPTEANQFDYEGKHFTLFVPDDLKTLDIPAELYPNFFELQIKTLFQHAWGEANHDLVYKPIIPITREHRRLVGYAAAQAWGADEIFKRLSAELLSRSDAD